MEISLDDSGLYTVTMTRDELGGLCNCIRHLVSGTNDGHHDTIASSVRDKYTREFLKTVQAARID